MGRSRSSILVLWRIIGQASMKKFIVHSLQFMGILLCLFFFNPTNIHAAEIYFGTQGKEVSVGQTFEVGVFLNTTEEAVNAVEASITVPDDVLVIKDIREGNSFVSLWLEKPAIEKNTVSFAGIMPGGYNGNEAYLFSMILEAVKPGTVVIQSEQEQILLHDGDGNSAQLAHAPLTLTVKEAGVTSQYMPAADSVSPESFVPEIGQDPSLFEGKWFVAFTTQDKQSGVAHYDLWESKRAYSEERLARKMRVTWREVQSPAVLEDQALQSYIYVRATDKSGNIRIAQISPMHPLPWYENIANWSILLVGALLVFGAILWFLFRMNRKNQ